MQRQRDRLLRGVAERHQLVVPSLVADKRVDDDHDGTEGAEDETDVIAGALS